MYYKIWLAAGVKSNVVESLLEQEKKNKKVETLSVKRLYLP